MYQSVDVNIQPNVGMFAFYNILHLAFIFLFTMNDIANNSDLVNFQFFGSLIFVNNFGSLKSKSAIKIVNVINVMKICDFLELIHPLSLNLTITKLQACYQVIMVSIPLTLGNGIGTSFGFWVTGILAMFKVLAIFCDSSQPVSCNVYKISHKILVYKMSHKILSCRIPGLPLIVLYTLCR